MQMYTYMSGKKTQYFAQSRQSIMGKWFNMKRAVKNIGYN